MKKRLIALFALLAIGAGGARGAGVSSIRHAEATPTAAVADGIAEIKEGVEYRSRLLEILLRSEQKTAVAEAKSKGADGEIMLIPGGTVFGARIKCQHTRVKSAAEGSVLKTGDEIIAINGRRVTSLEHIKELINKHGGGDMTLVVKRGGEEHSLTVAPNAEGRIVLGAELTESTAGIGTMTYIDPRDGSFGGLGHGICDPDSGKVYPIRSGEVTGVILGGVQRGECGKPGELTGILVDRPFGTLYRNTGCGVFGKLTTTEGLKGKAIPICKKEDVKAADATVTSTIKNGITADYSIRITSIDTAEDGSKCFKFKVTDPALIALTGGVVRGMSGSPIIQDGKLVGAVTHVMVADPTEGYGIFIENMLSAAENTIPKAA